MNNEEPYNLCFRLRNGKIRTWEYPSWSKALKAASFMDKYRCEGDPLSFVQPVSDKLKNPEMYES